MAQEILLKTLNAGDRFFFGSQSFCLKQKVDSGWAIIERVGTEQKSTIHLDTLVSLEGADSLEENASLALESRPSPLTRVEKRVALQRKWAQTYKTLPPEDESELVRVLPSGLTRKEQQQFLRGALEDAKATWIRIFNSSWTKAEVERQCLQQGVAGALRAFDQQTRKRLQGAFRLLTDS